VNRKLILLLSGILALLAVFLMQLYKRNLARELGVAGQWVTILVAREDIAAFTPIAGTKLRVKEFPANYLPPRYIKQDFRDDIVGQITNYTIKKGSPILTSDLASTQDEARLSQIIQDEMRALALPVNEVNTFGGLLRPKDHVDILGTFQKPGSGRVETVTLLQNVTVLAVGSKLGSGREVVTSNSRSNRSSRNTTVTVLVTPEEAELLVFAQDRGEFSLTMRNEEDVDAEMALAGKNFADIFEPAVIKRIQKKRSSKPGLNIIRAGSGKRRR
jgi:pilus assembly protein CpaB